MLLELLLMGVNGDIYASDQLYIAAKAVVEGSVHYRLFEMEKGAQISGNMVHRSGPSKDSKPSSDITEVMDNGVN
jgi:cytoskeletal protein CcmA (bactofilin family)